MGEGQVIERFHRLYLLAREFYKKGWGNMFEWRKFGVLASLVLTVVLAALMQIRAAKAVREPRDLGDYQTLYASNPSVESWFGEPVATDSTTLAIGAVGIESVYLFERSSEGPGDWVETQVISGTGSFGQWGIEVSDEWLFVSAAAYDAGGDGEREGAVYIYKRGPMLWEFFKLLSPATTDAFYGYSIDFDGDTLVVGAPIEDINIPADEIGRIYIHERDQGGPDNWGLVKTILPSDQYFGTGLGTDVSIDVDTIVAGTSYNDPVFVNGIAYVFDRNHGGPNNWGETITLTPSSSGYFGNFGKSVVVTGTRILVGDHSQTTPSSGPYISQVYVYERNEGGQNQWGEIAQVTPINANEPSTYGSRLAAAGTYFAISAHYSSPESAEVEIYEWVDSSYSFVDRFVLPFDGLFGSSVSSLAMNNDFLIVGNTQNGDLGFHHGVAYSLNTFLFSLEYLFLPIAIR